MQKECNKKLSVISLTHGKASFQDCYLSRFSGRHSKNEQDVRKVHGFTRTKLNLLINSLNNKLKWNQQKDRGSPTPHPLAPTISLSSLFLSIKLCPWKLEHCGSIFMIDTTGGSNKNFHLRQSHFVFIGGIFQFGDLHLSRVSCVVLGAKDYLSRDQMR